MAEERDQSDSQVIDDGARAAFRGNDAAGAGDHAPDRLVTAVNAGVDRILRAFDEKIRYDETKQQAIDRQHDELVGHRRDLVARAAAPFVYGMIHHHAEIGKLIAAVREEYVAGMPVAKVCDLLSGLQEDVEQVLGENGVAAYRPEALKPFDPERQRVVGKARLTDDENHSGTIAACLGPGFEREGRILVKAPVSAYRYEPASPDSTDAEPAPPLRAAAPGFTESS